MRKSFILHIDSLCILDKMSQDQAGAFIKAVYQYQTTGTLPEMDMVLEMAITPFINQFSRDNEAYERTAERNKKNGEKGGRPASKPKKPTGLNETQNNPKNPDAPDSDSDSDSKNDSDNGNKKKRIQPTVEDVIKYFSENGYPESYARKVFKYYAENNWHDSNGKKVIAWKQKVQANWFKEDKKSPTNVVQMPKKLTAKDFYTEAEYQSYLQKQKAI